MVEFGELRDVDLREVWPHEAHNFTPWLAERENLSRLSRAIGIPELEPLQREANVSGFSADILAEIPSDGSLVLIENQLGNTDHTHLGQIMTYLAGLKAQTAVWVARNFAPAHLEAIRWLNEYTSDAFAFFAVKVRVVKMGDNSSVVAPLFEVMEQPNEWNRELAQAQPQIRESSEQNQQRNSFWRSYEERYPGELNIHPNHVHPNVKRRVEGIPVDLCVAYGGVGIFIARNRIRNNIELTTLANECADALRERGLLTDMKMGETSNWAQIDAHSPDTRVKAIDWLHEQLGIFREVIIQVIAEQDSESPTDEPEN